ncbi:squalene/phytoene synthase family protein [Fodinicurvata sp. EGI_FJ10296]|uniref:squalene/phytoene synthase family protein n=1 Tax=Fodinicurvata sp. EGI_FJ10296 TaxID=3231908 RepID=UPI003453E4A8
MTAGWPSSSGPAAPEDTANARAARRKSDRDESFPVASRLLGREIRPVVLAFYRFARSADDIADDPARDRPTALADLGRIEQALRPESDNAGRGDDDPVVAAGVAAARDFSRLAGERGISDRHARDLLVAFRRDIAGMSYETWDDLMDYCRWSAVPVGRFLLDLHGEADGANREAVDGLCAALQILNHVQDCAADLRTLGRVYIPMDLLCAHGAAIPALRSDRCSVPLRMALNACLDGAADLLGGARNAPSPIAHRGLNAQYRAAIVAGDRLCHRLRHGDPLAARVDLSALDRVWIGAAGLAAFVQSSARKVRGHVRP